MNRRLGSATLSQLAFPGEGNPNFPWQESHWDDTVVKSYVYKKKKKKKEVNNRLGVDLARELRYRRSWLRHESQRHPKKEDEKKRHPRNETRPYDLSPPTEPTTLQALRRRSTRRRWDLKPTTFRSALRSANHNAMTAGATDGGKY